MTLKREIKDAYIENGDSIYVKTHSNAVYVNENETETLTQRLDNVKSSIAELAEHTSQLNESVYYQNINVEELVHSNGTHYWVTTILPKDVDNSNLELKIGFANDVVANKVTLETPRSFSKRHNATLVCNAGVFTVDTGEIQGNVIVNSQIINENASKKILLYTIGIKPGNILTCYPPGTTCQQILDDGCQNALTVFSPVIINGAKTPESVYGLNPAQVCNEPYARQFISQKSDGTIILLTVDGKFNNGLTIPQCQDILISLGVNFAIALDGGGSTQTVYKNQLVNYKIDNNRQDERAVGNYFYIAKDNLSNKDKDIVNSYSNNGDLKSKFENLFFDFNNYKKDIGKKLSKTLFSGTNNEISGTINLSESIYNFKSFIVGLGVVGNKSYMAFHIYPVHYGEESYPTIFKNFKASFQRNILGKTYNFVLNGTDDGNITYEIRDDQNVIVTDMPNTDYSSIRNIIGCYY